MPGVQNTLYRSSLIEQALTLEQLKCVNPKKYLEFFWEFRFILAFLNSPALLAIWMMKSSS